MRVKAFLMELWFYACPLWLELCADAHTNGINMGYNGAYSTSKARQPGLQAQERNELIAIIEEDMSLGRNTPWSPANPFDVSRLVPMSTVDKAGGTSKRAVKNYSFNKSASVNDESDIMYLSLIHL